MLTDTILILEEDRMQEAIKAIIPTVISADKEVDKEETTGLWCVLLVGERDMSVHNVLLLETILAEQTHIWWTTVTEHTMTIEAILYRI